MNRLDSAVPLITPVALQQRDARRTGDAPPAALNCALGAITIAAGCVYALWKPYRFSTDDAVSYLDVADAYRLHHWREALNGYWSPLYSWILAAAESVWRPSASTEILLVRIVNLALYLSAFAAFHFVARRVRHLAAGGAAAGSDTDYLPEWLWLLLAYPLFLWAALEWIGPRTDTPDMCAAALVLAAAGLSLHGTRGSTRQAFLVGAVAGLAYLAKTAMFVFAVAFIVANALNVRGRRQRTRRLCAGALAFSVVASPFIIALSLHRGRLTIGDAGTLNYVWMVNPTRRAVPDEHWQGGPPGFGRPQHASRRLWNDPPAYEFDGPVRGTYPPWTDPSYWYEGLTPRFDSRAQFDTAAANVGFYYEMFLKCAAAIFLVAWVLGALRRSIAALAGWSGMIVPAAVGLAVYLAATNLPAVDIATQPSARFVAPFAVLILLSLLASLCIADSPPARAALWRVAVAGAVAIWCTLAIEVGNDLHRVAAEQPVPLAVALRLHELGLRPGEAVAIVGNKYGRDYDHEFWARLARLRIVAQVTGGNRFFSLAPAEQSGLRASLAAAGARALVYKAARDGPVSPGWQPLASGYYLSFLPASSAPE